MKCNNCLTTYPSDINFCPNCGQQLSNKFDRLHQKSSDSINNISTNITDNLNEFNNSEIGKNIIKKSNYVWDIFLKIIAFIIILFFLGENINIAYYEGENILTNAFKQFKNDIYTSSFEFSMIIIFIIAFYLLLSYILIMIGKRLDNIFYILAGLAVSIITFSVAILK
ncbi:hypothetical protein OBK05_09980 [Empedobacter falsenii]